MTMTRSSTVRLGCFAFAIWLVVGSAPTSSIAAPLRWKFKLGEIIRYESAQTTVTKVKDPSGQELSQTLTLTMDLTWTVKQVDPQGQATLTETIDRIRTTATMPFGKFSFDSKENGDGTGPAGPLFKMLIGAEFTFKMNPLGELTEIKLSDKLLASLRGDNEPAGGPKQFSEAGLKNMLVQMGIPLSAEDVNVGKSWSRKVAIPGGPNGQTREIEQTYTDKGSEGKDKPVEVIEMVTKFEPIALDANLPVAIKAQEATGRFLFDAAAGRIDSSRVSERVDLSGQIEGKEIGQSNETVTVMTLLRDKAP